MLRNYLGSYRCMKIEELIKKLHRVLKNYVSRRQYIVSMNQDKLIVDIIKGAKKWLLAKHRTKNSSMKMLYIPSYYMIRYPRIFDLTMALSFLLRGCRITPVLTGFFHAYECVIYGGIYNEDRKRKIKDYNKIELKIWQKLLGLNYFLLENFRNSDDIAIAQEIVKKINFNNYRDILYMGYPVGKNAAYVTCNMNNMPELINEEKIIRQLKIHASNIVELMNAYNKIFDFFKPDVVFSNVPFYYKWGVVFHIAKRKNIPFYSAKMAEKKNAFMFSRNSDRIFDCTPAWSSFKKISISSGKLESKVNEIISKRNSRNFSHFSPYPLPGSAPKELDELMKRISGKKTIFFPVNVFFDAVTLASTPVFNNLVEMVEEVLQFFSKHKEFQLIIKAHPAEELFDKDDVHGYGKYILRNFILERQHLVSDNIIFLDYDCPISTHDIIPIIDLGIAYVSSAVMEMSLGGKPVIAVMDCHYSSKGFTYDPKNKKDFFDLILKLLHIPESSFVVKRRVELARRYYLLFSSHAQVDLKLFQGSDTGSVEDKFLFRNFKDLLPGKNNALDYICDSIINHLDIFGENRWPPET